MRAVLASSLLFVAGLAACDSDEEIQPTPTSSQDVAMSPTELPTLTTTEAPPTPWFLTGAPTPTWVTFTDPALTNALREARDEWEGAGIQSYRYDLTLGCFCGTDRPVHVEVQDARVVSITGSSGNEIPVDDVYYELYASYATIERAFESALSELQDPDRVVRELTFDDSLGFPNHSLSDWLLGTDGGLFMAIESFEALP